MMYVLDQNYLRSKELENLIITEPNSEFIIPDIALLEMCKGDKWKETMLMSLKLLSSCPERVYFSMSAGDGLNVELECETVNERILLPDDTSLFIRELLRNIATNGSGEAINIMKRNIAGVKQEIQNAELNHARNQSRMRRHVKLVESIMPREQLKALRNGRLSNEDRLNIIMNISLNICYQTLLNKGFSVETICRFMLKKPLILRFFYISVRHCIIWASRGGFFSMPADKVTNEILDQDYVLIGSFFDRLLSKEKKVQEADTDLRALIAMTNIGTVSNMTL